MVNINNNIKIKELDYEPISDQLENDFNHYKESLNSLPPDELSHVFFRFFKKINIITGFFIFLLYILLNTDCFQLYVLKKINNTVYDKNTDTITDNGIILNGGILALSYMIFDAGYQQH